MMRRLKRFFTAPQREWPWAFAARNLLALGGAFWVMCAAIAVVNPRIPAYEELTAVTGTYQGLERQSGGSYHLIFTTEAGYTERGLIDSFIAFDRYIFLDAVVADQSVSLRYVPDEYRTIMELTAGGVDFLTYEGVRRATWNNNYLGMCVVPVVTAAAVAASWVWFWVRDRRDQRRAEKEAAAAAAFAADERKVLEQFVENNFGKAERIYCDLTETEWPVDIALIPAEGESRPFCRLVTLGMSRRAMEVPEEYCHSELNFAELMLLLPPEWDPDGPDQWPFALLRRIAARPFVKAGSVFPERLGAYASVLLAWGLWQDGSAAHARFPGGKRVNFYQLLLLLPEEEEYRKLRGMARLGERLKRYDVSAVVRERRESCCPAEEWFADDIHPFRLGREEDGWCGWLPMKGQGLDFRDPAYPRGSRGWLELAERFCRRYGWTELELLENGDYFYVRCREEDTIRPFLLAFRDFCEDPEQVDDLLEEDPEGEEE